MTWFYQKECLHRNALPGIRVSPLSSQDIRIAESRLASVCGNCLGAANRYQVPMSAYPGYLGEVMAELHLQGHTDPSTNQASATFGGDAVSCWGRPGP